jgi:ribosomal-protein-alanine N-acetyltransferase
MYRLIETERLLIRPITLEDKDFIFDLLNTNGWLEFIGDRNIKNTYDAEKYISGILSKNNTFYHVFETKENNMPIGIVTLLNRETQNYPDIGFAMLPKYAKKGYAYEASKNYLHQLANEKATNKILAITMPNNPNSIKLIEKLGLHYECTLTQHSEELHLYSITF